MGNVILNKKFKNLFSDTIVFAVGNVLAKLVLFILMPVYTSAMTTSEYGTGELIYNTVELTLPIVTLCLYEAAFRFAIDTDINQPKLLSVCFVTITKIFAAISVLSLIVNFFIRYQFTWYFILILFTWGYRQLFAQFARGIGKSKIFAVSGVIQALALCLFNIIFLTIFKFGIDGYLLSIILANIISIVYLSAILKINRYISFKEKDKAFLKKLLIYSVPMIPNTLSWWFVNISSRYIIVGFCGTAIAGLFTAAGKLPSVIHLLSTIFQQAWQFSTSKEMGNKGSNKFFSDVFKVYAPFILIATSGVVVATPLIAKVILQGDFYVAWTYVPLLLLSASLNCFSVYFASYYTAAKKNKMLMISTIIGAVTNVAICFITVPFIGVYGALIGSCVSYLVIVIIRIADTRKYANIKIDWIPNLLSLVILTIQSVILTIMGIDAIVPAIILFAAILIFNVIFYRKLLFDILHKILHTRKK